MRPASHHYPISASMLLDIQWWLKFLPRFHRVLLIKPSIWDFESLNFSTDAYLYGGGATCRMECISFVFPDCIFPDTSYFSFFLFQLFTIIVSLKHWGHQLWGCKFIIVCDTPAVVAVINSTTSKDPFMQRCLRQLWFTAALFDFEVRALHVTGKHNQFVDCLSRRHSDTSARDLYHQIFHFQDVDSACFSFNVA